ncbi:MAG: sugar ABC transporter permease [Lachnospiraceae bacterium]|nr:sugar ABC transporter permease [Lachnospiraceae bacterium]
MKHTSSKPRTKQNCFQAACRYIWRYKYLYLLLVPAVLYFLIFHYIPMYGVIISFKDYSFKKGILGSDWVGFENFIYMFKLNDFYRVFRNSFFLSFLRLVFEFPVPIIIALLLNEISSKRFKKLTQTAIYLPHFISWAVIGGILVNFLSPTWGVVNNIIQSLGFEPIFFLGNPKYFRPTAVVSSIWKEAGWGTIIYLAAITGIDMEQYEAATVDGANRWQRLIYITLPNIKTTIILMLILRMGSIMSNGFEQIFTLQNTQNLSVSEVFETYTYRVGLLGGRFSFATTVGLFASVISMIFLLTTNFISKKMGEETIF